LDSNYLVSDENLEEFLLYPSKKVKAPATNKKKAMLGKGKRKVTSTLLEDAEKVPQRRELKGDRITIPWPMTRPLRGNPPRFQADPQKRNLPMLMSRKSASIPRLKRCCQEDQGF
jgi:hypothetical protein